MTGRRLHGDDGQVAPMAVVLVTAILVMSGLVLDGGRILATRRDANAVAANAARAGAQGIDLTSVRTSGSRLDPVDAEERARRFLVEAGAEGDIVITDDEVSVTVHAVAHPVLLSIVGFGDRPVTGHGTSRIRRGQ